MIAPESAFGVIADTDVQSCYSAADGPALVRHRSARRRAEHVMMRSVRAGCPRRAPSDRSGADGGSERPSYARRRAAADRRLRRRRHRRLGGAARLPPSPARAASSAVPARALGRGPNRARATHRHDAGLPALRPVRAPRRPDRGADHGDVGRAHDARRAPSSASSSDRHVGPPARRIRFAAVRRPHRSVRRTSSSGQIVRRASLPTSSITSSHKARHASPSTSSAPPSSLDGGGGRESNPPDGDRPSRPL